MNLLEPTSLALALTGALAGCATTPSGEPMGVAAAEINATLTDSELVLAPGDVLSVRFPRLSDWNQEDVAVQSDGRASFLSIDDMVVAGLTLAALDAKLTAKYAEILTRPELTIRTTEVAPRTIVIMGEVKNAGSFPLPPGRLSLIEALGLAGGFKRESARLDQTMLVRWIPDKNRVRAWKIDASTDHWDSEGSILLQAHDVLFIPAKPVVHVNDWIDLYIRRMIPFPYLVAQ